MSLIKKSFSARVLLALILVFSLSAFAPMAQDGDVPVLDNILKIIASFGTLAGISALLTALVALAYRLNWIKSDEQAGKVTAGLNLLAFIILVALGVFRPDLSLGFLDSIAAKMAAIALFVLGLYVQLAVPAPVLRSLFLARVPVLGVMGDAETIRPVEYRNYTNPPQG